MPYRTIMLAVVPDTEPDAEKRWLEIDASLPAAVTYIRERRDVLPEELPARWRRSCEIFAEHVPAGHHLVALKLTSDPRRPDPVMRATRPAFIVWNEARTEGYVTFDRQVAYEARKGAESNCFDQDGTQMHLAQAFCEVTGTDNCTVQRVDLPAAFDPDDFHRR